MWKLLRESVVGTSHERFGTGCQDHSFGTCLHWEGETILIASCSDGAGSAKYSDEASRLVSQRVVQRAAAAIQEGLAIQGLTRETMLEWYSEMRQLLESQAVERGAELRDYACTLLVAIVGENQVVCAQLGDGAILVGSDDILRIACWPQAGEYANTTNFLTDRRFDEGLDFYSEIATIDRLAMLTDGLQSMALNLVDRAPHGPFFAPMLNQLAQVDDAEELVLPLRQFLGSPAVNSRTDDDKTLVLAVRRVDHVA